MVGDVPPINHPANAVLMVSAYRTESLSNHYNLKITVKSES